MKKRLFILGQILLCLFGVFFSTPASAKDVENFYFSSFNADYYVDKAADGTAKMHVVEELTAVFPDFDQNKGIYRRIPYTIDKGRIVVMDAPKKSDFNLTRNGLPEPVYSLERENDYYELCTGTEEYIHGRQTFRFEYDLKNVALEFVENGNTWQELNWNVNGTAWKQKFNIITAKVHFADPSILTGDVKCFAGKYGVKDQSRCETHRIDDGFVFLTTGIGANEALTFYTKIKAGSFSIPDPEESHLMVIVAGVVVLISIIILCFVIKKYRATADKRNYYKNYFINPEYAPSKDYTLNEMASVYIGNLKDVKVALLLQMLVEKKIELKKGEKKVFGGQQWSIIVKNKDGLDTAESTLLKIVNGGADFEKDQEIKIKRHTASSSLVALGRKFSNIGVSQAKKDKLVESKFTGIKLSSTANIIVTMMLILSFSASFLMPAIIMACLALASDSSEVFYGGRVYVLAKPMIILIIVDIIVTLATAMILLQRAARVKYHTMEGLAASRYMDGLKLYINMAEKDRLEFLQSVKGADVTDEGIVKIYEKLLPYAALFGLEKSWMKELEKYCEIREIKEPDWYHVNNFAAFYTVSHTLHSASNFVSYSTHYSSGGSSGFSGGGGGGFSGGGGGGGGGGGR